MSNMSDILIAVIIGLGGIIPAILWKE